MASKTVLVHSGMHTKPVVFDGDLATLKDAVVSAFSLQVSPRQLLIQQRSVEWNGEWVDVSDNAVIKAVIIEASL